MTTPRLSFFFFLAAVAAVGVFFFRIVQPFLLPLLVAGIVALIFRPVYLWMTAACGGRERVAAGLTTLLALVIVLAPLAGGLTLATRGLIDLAGQITRELPAAVPSPALDRVTELREHLTEAEFELLRERVVAGRPVVAALPLPMVAEAHELAESLERDFSRGEVAAAFRALAPDEPGVAALPWLDQLLQVIHPLFPGQDAEQVRRTALGWMQTMLVEVYNRTTRWVANVVAFLIGFAVMLLALYYFLAEGPHILKQMHRLLPLEEKDEDAVFSQFDRVCRGVVLGMLLSALVQAALMAVGLTVARVGQVWLLATITAICAILPFVGAFVVYVPVGAYLIWQDRLGAGVGLILFGALIVSTSDNLIRAYVIHGKSQLHPLTALVSVLGGVQLIGLWGIFIGPIVAGIFFAMLELLRAKLEETHTAPADEGGEKAVEVGAASSPSSSPSRQAG